MEALECYYREWILVVDIFIVSDMILLCISGMDIMWGDFWKHWRLDTGNPQELAHDLYKQVNGGRVYSRKKVDQ